MQGMLERGRVNGDIGDKIRVKTFFTVFRNVLGHIQIAADYGQIKLIKDGPMMQNIMFSPTLGIA